MCVLINWTRFSCASRQETATQTQPTEATAINVDEYGNLPKAGDLIISGKTRRYKLIKFLGKGYGQVFEAVNEENRRFAVKVEKFYKSKLDNETEVLIRATQYRCTRILKFIEYGYSKPNYFFLVMPLLGKNLSTLRNDQQFQCFTQPTAVRVGMLTLMAIRELHSIGYISRDVKPSNFAIGLGPNNRCIFLIDFGLARKFVDSQNNIIPQRKQSGWRGTTRYGSLQAHMKLDLSRKDDVESWFYSLVEFIKAVLPWRKLTNRDMVHASKISARSENRSFFMEECPKEFDEILTLIDNLNFTDVPPYERIYALLERIMEENSYTWEQCFDWEDELTICSSAINRSTRESDNADEDIKTAKTAILPD